MAQQLPLPIDRIVEKEYTPYGFAFPSPSATEGVTTPLSREEQFARARNRENQARAYEPVTTRVPEKVLPKILQTEDIRSQHETGGSMGYLNPEYRADAEQRMGFDDHPVYGYVDDGSQRAQDLRPYGNVQFEMKHAVKDRTTVMEGDSLPMEGESRVTQPVSIRDVQRGERLPNFQDALAGQNIDREPDFIETQVHSADGSPNSRIPLSDVHAATIEHLPRRAEYFQYKEIGDQLTEKGVNVRHKIPETRHQPPLPFNNIELAQQGFTQSYAKDPARQGWRRDEKDSEGNRVSNTTFGHRTVRHKDLT